MSRALQRLPIHVIDLVAAAAVVSGLAIFQLTARPTAGRSVADQAVLGWCVAAALAVTGIGLVAARVHRGRRAQWLGFCAGASYGLVAALLKSTVGVFDASGISVLTSWTFYAFLVVVTGAITVNQIAFNAGPLAHSLPLITIIDPLVSVAIGAAAFAETVSSSGADVIGQGTGFMIMSVGVVLLSRRAATTPPSTTLGVTAPAPPLALQGRPQQGTRSPWLAG
jgi:hypothetical protein